MAKKNNVVNLESALNFARRELAEKAPSHPFWSADAAQLNDALDNVDMELIRSTIDVITTVGLKSSLSRLFRDEIKRQLATHGLNKFACAGVSCALAHAVWKLTINR